MCKQILHQRQPELSLSLTLNAKNLILGSSSTRFAFQLLFKLSGFLQKHMGRLQITSLFLFMTIFQWTQPDLSVMNHLSMPRAIFVRQYIINYQSHQWLQVLNFHFECFPRNSIRAIYFCIK